MTDTNHYERTKTFFRRSALERKGYYDAKPGEPLKHNRWQPIIRKMILKVLDQLLKENSGNLSTLIDVGCGKADFALEIARRYPNFTLIYGTDFSRETLSIAREETKEFEQINICEANLLELPFEDRKFDITICVNVLHHIHQNDLPRAIEQLSRITRKYLIMEIKNDDNFYYHYIHPKTFSGITVYLTSVRQLNPLLKGCGFRLKKQKGIFVFNRLSPLVMPIYERV